VLLASVVFCEGAIVVDVLVCACVVVDVDVDVDALGEVTAEDEDVDDERRVGLQSEPVVDPVCEEAVEDEEVDVVPVPVVVDVDVGVVVVVVVVVVTPVGDVVVDVDVCGVGVGVGVGVGRECEPCEEPEEADVELCRVDVDSLTVPGIGTGTGIVLRVCEVVFDGGLGTNTIFSAKHQKEK
jgi:hypothetical protein